MNTTKNQNNGFQIPMEVTKELINDFCIDPKDIKGVKIGIKKIRALLVDCSKEQYRAFIRPVWREIKQLVKLNQNDSLERMLDETGYEPESPLNVENTVIEKLSFEELVDYLNHAGKLRLGDIYRRFMEGYSTYEIMELFGIEYTTARYRIRKAVIMAYEYKLKENDD